MVDVSEISVVGSDSCAEVSAWELHDGKTLRQKKVTKATLAITQFFVPIMERLAMSASGNYA
jgi:hypothetical protein